MSEVIYCGNCGQANPATNKFCGQCGSPIIALPPDEGEITQPMKPVARVQSEAVMPIKIVMNTTDARTGYEDSLGWALILLQEL